MTDFVCVIFFPTVQCLKKILEALTTDDLYLTRSVRLSLIQRAKRISRSKNSVSKATPMAKKRKGSKKKASSGKGSAGDEDCSVGKTVGTAWLKELDQYLLSEAHEERIVSPPEVHRGRGGA